MLGFEIDSEGRIRRKNPQSTSHAQNGGAEQGSQSNADKGLGTIRTLLAIIFGFIVPITVFVLALCGVIPPICAGAAPILFVVGILATTWSKT